MTGELRRILLEACVLVAFGALAGLSIHYQLVLDAFSGQLVPPRAAVEAPAGARLPAGLPAPVLLDEIEALVSGGALLVDARSPELFVAGHLPGAVPLPLVEVDEHLDGFLQTIDRQRTLVVYCSGFGCPDSFDLGMRLIAAGYTDVRVFEGGLPEWRDSGRPIVEGQP